MQDSEADAIVARVASEFKERRVSAGLSMNKLAAQAGLDQVAVARIESGERSPGLRTAVKLADALGEKLSDILAEAGH